MNKASQSRTRFKQSAANINLLWASLFIEELVRNNIYDFCIAPGSRSTPLTLAIAGRKDINTHLHFDERGLGFFALGIALAEKKPVVLITTSGTAVANLYPAVIEARQSNVPLIILSADRPPELINCGANQAINQYAIFADYPVFFQQIPSPTAQIKPNYLLTTINQGLAKQKDTPAPIHFNLAFPEPRIWRYAPPPTLWQLALGDAHEPALWPGCNRFRPIPSHSCQVIGFTYHVGNDVRLAD